MLIVYDGDNGQNVYYILSAIEDSPYWDLQYSSLKEIPTDERMKFIMSLPEYDRPPKEQFETSKPVTSKDMKHLHISMRRMDGKKVMVTIGKLFTGPKFRKVGWERLRDLAKLPRFTLSTKKKEASVFEEPVIYKAVIGLNLDIDSDRDTYKELKDDPRYEIYFQLEDLEGEIAAGQVVLHELYEDHNAFDPFDETTKTELRNNRMLQHLPKALICNIKDIGKVPLPSYYQSTPNVFIAERAGKFVPDEPDKHPADINHYLYNELFLPQEPYMEGESSEDGFKEFVNNKFDGISYSYLNRRGYFETNLLGPEDKPFYEADSVYTKKLYDYEKLGVAKTIGKESREQRHKKLLDLLFEARSWCRKGEMPTFSIEIIPALITKDHYELVERDNQELAAAFRVHCQEEEQVNIWSGRFHSKKILTKPVITDTSGLVIIKDMDKIKQAKPVEIIQHIFKSIFRVAGRSFGSWQKVVNNHYLQGRRMIKAPFGTKSYKTGINNLAISSLMGICLTAEQQHEIRERTRELCDLFETPYPKGVIENYTIVSQKSVLQNEGRKLKKQIDEKFMKLSAISQVRKSHELQEQITHLTQEIDRLSRRALSINYAKQNLQEDGKINITETSELLEEHIQLQVNKLRGQIVSLEDQIQALTDPTHPQFNCDLSTLQDIRRKEALSKTWQQLINEYNRLDLDKYASDIGKELSRLYNQYDSVELAGTTFINDLPIQIRSVLGYEDTLEDTYY